jgi:hypothetical protein
MAYGVRTKYVQAHPPCLCSQLDRAFGGVGSRVSRMVDERGRTIIDGSGKEKDR